MYARGRDFNCTSASCYGIGSIPHVVFQQLQKQANATASLLRLSLKPLAIDGKLGVLTVQMVVEIAKRVPGEHLALIRSAPSPERLAQYASEVIAEMAAVPPAAGTKPPSTPSLPTPIPTPPVLLPQAPIPPPVSTVPVPSSSPIPGQPQLPAPPGSSPAQGTNLTWWLLGGGVVTLLAVIGIGLYVRARSEAEVMAP